MLSIKVSPNSQLLIDSSGSLDIHMLDAFSASSAKGLLCLALARPELALGPSAQFWQKFVHEFLNTACTLLETTAGDAEVPLADEHAQALFESAPPMQGLEYLDKIMLKELWLALDLVFVAEFKTSKSSFREFLHHHYPAWSQVGRIAFHLAENKQDQQQPFAFLATYVTRLSSQGRAQHVPIGKAFQEFAGSKQNQALLALLTPINAAAEQSSFLHELVESRELFHTLAWSPMTAFHFLQDVAHYEAAGIIVKIPRWKNARPQIPTVTVKIGDKSAALLDASSLIDFSVQVSLGDSEISASELDQILRAGEGLIRIRGEWVQVNSAEIQQVLDHWQKIARVADTDGISFHEGMRLLAGVPSFSQHATDATVANNSSWSRVEAGAWLKETLQKLSGVSPSACTIVDTLTSQLHTALRPYQRSGVEWLWLLYSMRLGGCLADDMGLGKTVQVLALLLLIKQQKRASRPPSLLIVPATLVGNWRAEISRFAPALQTIVVHATELRDPQPADIARQDLVITTYGYVRRCPLLTSSSWDAIILDEAQAIKNPSSKQSKEVRGLSARVKFALTGTPIENSASDLWSLFDFINPGLLGSAKDFDRLLKSLQRRDPPTFAPLRNVVRPYILRRLKTDRSVISDLPEKTELRAYCMLSKAQGSLYQKCVNELKQQLEQVDGIKRRGIILSFLMQFKQICNHPAHWLGSSEASYEPALSGKFDRLKMLAEEISARQEKLLVFTQFRELTEVISDYLRGIFGQPGLVLHGGTPQKKRQELVDKFQTDPTINFLVLSLKAGGTGLNLTAASHVVHFDRWWNPAVENQATDRAFRIGQKRNVLVHKFICRGTLEVRIDEMIESKKSVAAEILSGGAEKILTEMTNDQLLQFVALDINSAIINSAME